MNSFIILVILHMFDYKCSILIRKPLKEGLPMITPERISQDVCDSLLEFNLIDPNTYEYGELRTLLIELTKGDRLHTCES